MPQIIALRPTSVAGVDLGHSAFQVGYGSSILDTGSARVPCFSLLFFYPQATSALYRPGDGQLHMLPAASTALVQAPISLAGDELEIGRVCAAAREGGSEDADIQRMKEALELFRNRSARISDGTLQACVEDAAAVIRTYWKLREWFSTGMKELETLMTETSFAQREGQKHLTTLVCRP